MDTNQKTKLLSDLAELLTPQEEVKHNDVSQLLQEILLRLESVEKMVLNHQFIAKELTSIPHASQQRFEIPEANEIFLVNTTEKACRFEPDKPCDFCSMCSARGF